MLFRLDHKFQIIQLIFPRRMARIRLQLRTFYHSIFDKTEMQMVIIVLS
jgi:hypothetical protein